MLLLLRSVPRISCGRHGDLAHIILPLSRHQSWASIWTYNQGFGGGWQ